MTAPITNGRRTGFVPPGRTRPTAREIDAVILDYLFFAVAADGILYNPAEYNDPNIACEGFTYTKENGQEKTYAWKKGIIGALSQEQIQAFCTKVVAPKSQGLSNRIKSFEEASAKCEREGATTLETRLQCMSEQLRKSKNPPPLGHVAGIPTTA